MTESPRWRQAYDAVDKAVTPHAESLVRTPAFALAAALLRRSQATARGAARGLSARAWHLVNLPAGSDVSRLRAQIGALDREVRRLTVQLETQRRRGTRPAGDTQTTSQLSEDRDGERAQSAGRARSGTTRRRAQRAPGP
jgi:hypothetical protein